MRIAALLLGLLAVAACASQKKADPGPAEPTAPRAGAPDAPSAAETEVTVEEPLSSRPTLEEVLQRAESAPAIRAARELIARERGALEQAGLIPNPVLTLKADRIDMKEIEEGTDRYRVTLRERIETAGKRGARSDVAGESVRASEEARRAESLRVARLAATLHQRALAAQLVAAARREALGAARELLTLEEQRVSRGRAPEAVVPPLRARVGRLRVALAEDTERGRVALRTLEGLLALPPGAFEGVSGEPLLVMDLPPAEAPEARATIAMANPELAVLAADARRAEATLRHAQALAWPDVTVGLEYEDGREPDRERQRSLGIFLEVPLPIADRNQGSIEAARAEERRIGAVTEEATARILAAYAETLESVRARRESLQAYEDDILPAQARDLELAVVARRGGRADETRVLLARLAVAESLVEAGRLEEALAVRHLEALAILGRDPETW